ncbi:hypothetical protein [Algoriphagus sediminis]|uniref:DUF4105 domain-containing protein n=1 Tax=Algoriphagus sediminis TaxID=3057113 RepID=A0ABT7YD28_9BACT|nr:hypothetical protein [Algoriphagus sediminis]MDN3204422.1 hypothetical protein [Algoriphagus sediminis]
MCDRLSNKAYSTFLSFLLFAFLLTLVSCNEDEENAPPVVQFKGIAAAFNDQVEALEYSLTIFVDQPGAGGTAETWVPVGFMDVDAGHAFVKLERLNADSTQTTIIIGYYPDKIPNDPNQLETNGELRDDTKRLFEVSKKYVLTKENFDKALAYIESVERTKKKYHLNNYNCADFAIQVGLAAGENVPDTYGAWDINFGMGKRLTGGGSNPGNLGQDLRQ